jgi:hypothetical protein
MDNHKLDELLGCYKSTALPRLPGNLRQNVWREIRLRQSAPLSSALNHNEFLAWFRGSMTSLAAPTLALTLLMSIGLTMLTSQSTSRHRVQQALGLEVFSHQSSPLARLAQNP